MIFGSYEVPVAMITAFALVLAATVPSVIAYIGNRRIGKPNGRGNVVEMVGQALDKATDAKRIAQATRTETSDRLDKQDRTLERIEKALRAALIDRGHAEPPEHG